MGGVCFRINENVAHMASFHEVRTGGIIEPIKCSKCSALVCPGEAE